jgi:hypothetical protein
MTDSISAAIEPCPNCGRPTPLGTRCVYCSTLTDLDLKNLPLDRVSSPEGDVSEGEVPHSVVVVERTGLKVPLTSMKMKIGRDPSNQLVVKEDTYASRHHAWITYEDGDFWIEDLGSTNGTLLNGHPVVKRQMLASGDKIRVGHTELTFAIEH